MAYQTKELEGRPHVVAPMVMLRVGVLHGSQGALFYPLAEIHRTMSLWNGRPIVRYHPQQYGHSSAGDPQVFNQMRVGVIFNSRLEGLELKADAWLDVERCDAVDPRILQRVRAGHPMEVSTGLFTDVDSKPGVWNGEAYQATAGNFVPDHLALLPDQVGACSLRDGCGLMRSQATYAAPVAANAVTEAPYVMPALSF